MKKLIISSLIITLTLGISSYVVATESSAPQAAKATGYLIAQRESNGSIGGVGYSGWALQALAANGQTSSGTVTYLENNLGDIAAQPATDIERTILAVIAGGRDPRNFGSKDLIAILKAKSESNQIGSPSYLNDDIFGILALLAAGEPVTDPVISDSINYLVSHQQSNGSFSWSSSSASGDSNNTAVAIEALEFAKQKGWTGSYHRDAAITYLQSVQDDSGGFPFIPAFGVDGSSTAWVIGAIRALGEDPLTWVKNGNNPISYLTTLQKESGGVSLNETSQPDFFTTSFAAIAFAGKALPVAVVVTTTPTPTPTEESTPTPTPSPTPTEEPTTAPTPTPTPTQSPSPSPTPTITPSPTPTPTASPSPTPTASPTTSPSPTPTPTPSPTSSPTPKPTATPTPAPTATAVVTATPSPQPTERTTLNQLFSTIKQVAHPTFPPAAIAATPQVTEMPSQPTDNQSASGSDPAVLGTSEETKPTSQWLLATIMIVAGLGLVGWGIANWFFQKDRPKARF